MIINTKVMNRINLAIHNLQRDKDNLTKKEYEKRLVKLETERLKYLKSRWLK